MEKEMVFVQIRTDRWGNRHSTVSFSTAQEIIDEARDTYVPDTRCKSCLNDEFHDHSKDFDDETFMMTDHEKLEFALQRQSAWAFDSIPSAKKFLIETAPRGYVEAFNKLEGLELHENHG